MSEKHYELTPETVDALIHKSVQAGVESTNQLWGARYEAMQKTQESMNKRMGNVEAALLSKANAPAWDIKSRDVELLQNLNKLYQAAAWLGMIMIVATAGAIMLLGKNLTDILHAILATKP